MKRKLLVLLLILSVVCLFPVQNVRSVPSITYAYPTITISGFPVGSPCSSWDVWNASVSNGWGVVLSTTFSGQYQFSTIVDWTITDGYFRDTNVELFFNRTWASARSSIWVQSGANLSLGSLVDPITKRTTEGVNIVSGASDGGGIIDVDSGGVLELYGCHLTSLAPDTLDIQGNATIYETTLTNLGLAFITSYSGATDVYRMRLEGATTGVNLPQATTVFDDFLVHSMSEGVGVAGAITSTFSDLVGRNNTKLVRTAFFSGNLYLVDADVDAWSFTYIVSPNGKIHRQYSFNLLVTYPNGTFINGTETGARVVVQHYGQGGAVDYNATLGGDGTIPPQALTMGFYNQAGGDTLQSNNPFNLHIYNVTGYAEYHGNFTLNGVKNEVIVLHEPVGYAGFVFIFLGLVIGLVVGGVIGFGSRRK